jgi:hypothetical protein
MSIRKFINETCASFIKDFLLVFSLKFSNSSTEFYAFIIGFTSKYFQNTVRNLY